MTLPFIALMKAGNVGRIARARCESFRVRRHDRHRLEVVRGELLVGSERLVDGKRGRGGEQGVAVRRRLRDERRGNVPAGSRTVLHHDGLA
jgi:hypothetical protein